MPTNRQIIKAEAKGFEKANKKIKGTSKSLKSMAKAALTVGVAMYGAKKVIDGMKAMVSLAAKQELSERKLTAALGKRSIALEQQAKALQKVSMFGDEVILQAQAMIAAFVKDERSIKLATQATLDLAAAKGFDLVTAADLVSKTLGSTTNALTRYGIQVEGAVGSQERLASLTENVAAAFGGQAAAQADTFTGQIEQMNNALGDVGELLGEMLLPFLGKIANSIKSVAEWMGVWLDTSPVDEMRAEQLELNALNNQLIANLDNQEQRNFLLGELNRKYPDFIGHLDSEALSQKILNERADEYNRLAEIKLDNLIAEQFVIAAQQDLNEAMEAYTSSLINIHKITNDLFKEASPEDIFKFIYGDIRLADPEKIFSQAADIGQTIEDYINEEMRTIQIETDPEKQVRMLDTFLFRLLDTFGEGIDIKALGAPFKNMMEEGFGSQWMSSVKNMLALTYGEDFGTASPEILIYMGAIQELFDVFKGASGDLDPYIQTLINAREGLDGLFKEGQDDYDKGVSIMKAIYELSDAFKVLEETPLESDKIRNKIEELWDTYNLAMTSFEGKAEMPEGFAEDHQALIDHYVELLHIALEGEEQLRSGKLTSKYDEIEETRTAMEIERDNLREHFETISDMTEEEKEKLNAIEAYYDEKIQKERKDSLRSMANDVIANLQLMGNQFKAFQGIAKAVAIAQTTYDTYEAAQEQFLAWSETKLPAHIKIPLAYAAATAAVGAGLARVDQIRKAQTGADYVTDGPEMLQVGEGGRERVTVTPLEDVGYEGGGQGITLTINNPILTDSFVEDSVVPSLREALRQGESLA